MKPLVYKISQLPALNAGFLAMILLFVLTSCATQPSNIGKIAPKNQVLPLAADEIAQERIWQAKDLEITYKTIKTGDTFTMEGSLSVNDSVTRTFPTVKWLKLYIYYLDENNKVISTHRVNVNTGYRSKLGKNLKFINVPEAPSAAVAFTFSYWGVMTGPSTDEGSLGDWEIYYDPFNVDTAKQNPEGSGLFYTN